MSQFANKSSSALTLRPRRILVAATGSVAAIKVPILIKRLRQAFKDDVDIKVIATTHALHFFKSSEIKPVETLTDADEWKTWKRITDPVLHIELRNWADLILIAPLDANTLSKLAVGMCDNLLTCVVRAWDVSKPVVVCPAMNTHMWEHPVTEKQLDVLKEFGYVIIEPICKTLACGDNGVGAMEEPEVVAKRVVEVLEGWGSGREDEEIGEGDNKVG
ncbi:flavoprotein [Gaertneriomyces semiglobifer]|nr:flavoprotein [Gaertneriomyces semiglobifer]